MYVLSALIRLVRPLYLLLAALTYTLGAGIARYLGTPLRSNVLVLGLAGVTLSLASMSLLAAVFRPNSEALVENESIEQRRLVRNAALYTAIAALAATGFIGFTIHLDVGLSLSTLVCLGLSLAAILLYGLPPVRALDRGFGELLMGVEVAYLAPSLGFLLQAGAYHSLLNASIVALTFLFLATLVALEFPTYADDLKHGRENILTRIGWQAALRTHHGLLIAGYLLLALPVLMGFSFRLFFPAFLTVPFAMLQAYLLQSLARGAKPIWNLLSANAVAVFGLTAYFLTLSFWLR
jgi:1,4-dihydroxy-2-naphthoate octaprenyltransferase